MNLQSIRRLYDYPDFLADLVSGRRARAELSLSKRRSADIESFGGIGPDSFVLDLGSGELRPQFTILAAQGLRVAGVDVANRPQPGLKGQLYNLARFLFRRSLPMPSDCRSGMLVCADVGRLPFPAATFDLVTSIAAFEHFLDIPAVLAEIDRTAKPGALIWVQIHPFTCISGGHNVRRGLGSTDALPDGIEPWDHLRRRKLQFTVPLNKWRISQYLEAFSTHFTILRHYGSGKEGEALLTPALRQELNQYTEEELTCSSYVIVARKN